MHGVCPLPHNLYTHTTSWTTNDVVSLQHHRLEPCHINRYLHLHVASASRHLSLQYGEGSCVCDARMAPLLACSSRLTCRYHRETAAYCSLIHPADLQIPYPPNPYLRVPGLRITTNSTSSSPGNHQRERNKQWHTGSTSSNTT